MKKILLTVCLLLLTIFFSYADDMDAAIFLMFDAYEELDRENYTVAEDIFEVLLESFPELTDAIKNGLLKCVININIPLYSESNYEEVSENIIKYEELFKDNNMYNYLLGLTYYKLNQYENAKTVLERYIAKEPPNEKLKTIIDDINLKLLPPSQVHTDVSETEQISHYKTTVESEKKLKESYEEPKTKKIKNRSIKLIISKPLDDIMDIIKFNYGIGYQYMKPYSSFALNFGFNIEGASGKYDNWEMDIIKLPFTFALLYKINQSLMIGGGIILGINKTEMFHYDYEKSNKIGFIIGGSIKSIYNFNNIYLELLATMEIDNSQIDNFDSSYVNYGGLQFALGYRF